MDPRIAESVKIMITDDSMEARLYLSSTPTAWGEDPTELFTLEAILEALQENGVKAGIDKALLKSILVNKLYDQYHVVARGKPAENGQDGRYTFLFKTEIDNKPKVLEDGSVDYHNIEMYEAVQKNQEVAVYTPATKGHFGFDVKNNFLSCIPGKELNPLKGEGFYVSEDNCHYYSLVTGKIELGRDNSLRITNTLEIRSDVDLTTGDISFGGDVIIHGSVLTGSKITCKGSLTILGSVEEATIYAGGPIEIKAGMQGGNKGSIVCDSEIWGKFFESTKIHCRGDFHANSIMNCEIFCEGNMFITGRFGIIVGGNTTCAGSIEATIIGNLSEVKTTVNVGTNPNAIKELSELEAEVKNIEVNYSKLHEIKKKFGMITNPVDRMKFTKTLEQIDASLVTVGTQLKDKTAELNQKLFLLSTYSNSKVLVHKFLYPNVIVTINGLHYTTRDTYTNVTLKDTGGTIQPINNY